MPDKKDWPTKRILKILVIINRQKSNKQTSSEIICTRMYAQ